MNWNKEPTVNIIKIIGKSVKTKRVAKEISQEELANISGVSHASIARFETGKGNLSLENLLLILKALEIADELKIIFKEKEIPPSLLAKAKTKIHKERVRKVKKKKEENLGVWKWGDEK